MAAHTTLLTFQVPPLDFANEESRRRVIEVIDRQLQLQGLRSGHSYHGNDLAQSQKQILISFISADGRDAILRGHSGGLITLDLHEYVDNGSKAKFSDQVVAKLEKDVKTELVDCVRSKSLPAVRRGEEVDVYYPTVDGRFAEYDFRKVVYQSRSRFQDVLIVESETLGNILILDGDINMGESDVIYSHTLMQRGKLDYSGKTCLVLGGGDGGLLHELLKENPKMVTMVDIDETVLTAVKTHLRGVCGNSLDSFEGPNYKVIVGDALEVLGNYVNEGRKFDYVLYDLTSIPIIPEEEDDEWEFCKTTHNLAMKVLAPNGYYLAQAHALLARRSIELFEELLRNFDTPVEWIRHEAFVPSFSEVWAFFQIWRKAAKDEKSNGETNESEQKGDGPTNDHQQPI